MRSAAHQSVLAGWLCSVRRPAGAPQAMKEFAGCERRDIRRRWRHRGLWERRWPCRFDQRIAERKLRGHQFPGRQRWRRRNQFAYHDG